MDHRSLNLYSILIANGVYISYIILVTIRKLKLRTPLCDLISNKI